MKNLIYNITNIKKLIFLLVLLCAITFILLACSAPKVHYIIIQSKPIVQVISTIGYVKAQDTIQVKPLVSGMINKIFKEEGEYVKAGETLVQIDDKAIIEKINQAEAELSCEILNFSQCAKELHRHKKLYEKNTIPKKLLEQKETECKKSKHAIDKFQSILKYEKEKKKEFLITIPESGIITKRFVDIGQVVSPQIILFNIISTNNEYVEVEVDELYANQLLLGERVLLKPTGIETEIIEGWIDYIAPAINQLSGSIVIKISFSTKHQLKTGQSVDINIPIAKYEQAISIPRSVINFADNNNYVWVIRDNKIWKQSVNLIDYQEFMVIVKDGLKDNDFLVLDNKQLSQGTKVKGIQVENAL